ncbi:MAG: hypothetical protein Q8L15_05625 [Methylobacter sp.]|jgi:hypothetical protein|nr:hypothetical protein [Methylobacter sp.]
MKIHPSSLALSPTGSSQKAGKNTSVQNKGRSVEKDAQRKSQPSSTEQIKKTLAKVDATDQSNIIKPTDSRTLRALSAYNQAFNAPQQAQRAQLITGIDAYA